MRSYVNVKPEDRVLLASSFEPCDLGLESELWLGRLLVLLIMTWLRFRFGRLALLSSDGSSLLVLPFSGRGVRRGGRFGLGKA